MVWIAVDKVFRGGSDEVAKLRGRKVRALRRMDFNQTFTGEDLSGPPATVQAGEIGFVGYMSMRMPEMVILAFPTTFAAGMTFDQLLRSRGAVRTVVVNWITFRINFEIER
jgi:hypothetical protein